MRNIMCDIETLDVKPTAVILSIGACAFDPDKGTISGDTFHRKLEIDPQIAAGRTISGSTIDWWMNQSDAARSAIFSQEAQAKRSNVRSSLAAFDAWFGSSPKAPVWGNGADFDLVLLTNLYQGQGFRPPWYFSSHRCFRTLKNLFGDGLEPERQGTHHDALDDALHQARWANAIFAKLRG